jgi:hypothetical protein
MTSGPTQQCSDLGHQNWENIFKHIFKPWDEVKLYNFLTMFGNYNTATSHNKTESIAESQQPDLRQFVIDSMYFLQKLNLCYYKLIDRYITTDSKHFVSFTNESHQGQNSILISPTDLSDFVRKLSNLDEILIPIQNDQVIEALYNT